MIKRIGFLCVLMASVAGAALGNLTAGAARVIVPDGTLYVDNNGASSNRWFVFIAEVGRSYAVEAYNTNDYPPFDHVKVDLFEADGTTPFFNSNSGSCGSASSAPSLEGTLTGAEGARCLFLPSLSSPGGARYVKIRVQNPENQPPSANACGNCLFRLRVRETTITSRWSVNGYHMFVALHNPGTAPLAGAALYYSDAGALVLSEPFAVPTLGSTQLVHSSGTLNPNHGGLNIVINGTSGGAVDADVQTYAFAPGANNFNFFVIYRPNHGGPGSQGYGN